MFNVHIQSKLCSAHLGRAPVPLSGTGGKKAGGGGGGEREIKGVKAVLPESFEVVF